MGFHKRWITGEAIKSAYESSGVSSVWDMFTSGADALILHGDLAEDCFELIEEGDRSGLEKRLAELDK